jgi:S1-C subfamily serine protease
VLWSYRKKRKIVAATGDYFRLKRWAEQALSVSPWLTPEKARPLGYAEKTEGVPIAQVEPDGVASGAGLRRGMLILKVDHQQVKTVQGSPEGS